jgi:PAS domain S-box-containing protein
MPSRQSKIWGFLRPPDLKDPIRNARAANVHFISILIFAGLGLWLPVGGLLVGSSPESLLISAGVLVVCAASFAQVRAGHLLRAGIALAAAIWVLQTALLVAHPNVRSVSFGGYVLVVVIAGFLAGRSAAILSAVGAIAAGAIVLAAGPSDQVSGTVLYLTSWGVYLAIAAGLLVFSSDNLGKALRLTQATQERFRALTEGSRDLVSELDEDGHFVYASANHEQVLGRRAADLRGQDAFALVHPEDLERIRAIAVRLSNDEQSDQVPLRYQHADGSWRWLETDSHLFETAEGGRHLMTVSRDVTERRMLEDQLRQSQRLESMGRLAGGIAHDFNNLLMVIQANSDVILRDGPNEAASEIAGAVQTASELTRQILTFSRAQTIRPRVVDLNGVVRGCEGMVARLIGNHIEVQTRLMREEARVMADPAQLEQILINLVVNAHDAMPDGGQIAIETRLVGGATANSEEDSENASSAPDFIELAVSDTGTGIEDSVLSNIFDPFFTTKDEGRGTGLGLSTVHGIVTQNGGSIEVDTKMGEGTTFRVLLARTREALSEQTKPAPAVKSPAGPRKTVLLVEDNQQLLALLNRALSEAGFHVLEASNGRAAYELAANGREHIDILVTDLIMPEMGGVELRDRLVEDRPGLSSLFMSGHERTNKGSQYVLAPQDRLIIKPFSTSFLVDQILEVLRGPSSE